MRKALVVGINYYEHCNQLYGCVSDATNVDQVLLRHGDGSINFSVKTLVSSDKQRSINKAELKSKVRELFSGEDEISLFYFAGHGHIESTGGYICGSDSQSGDDGLALGEVLSLANQSRARNRVILLDSCHSGVAGARPGQALQSELSEGITVLTASTAEQYAKEQNGAGVFTSLLVNALNGAAANLVGDITPGSVYAHIDQSLGPWDQRPVFKTNVKSFVSLRRVVSPIQLPDLRRLKEFFPTHGFEFKLDPSFEPERGNIDDPNIPPPNPKNTAIFAVLQKLNRVNLVVPVDAPHMYHAAMGYKSCRLTDLGEHYRRLAYRDRI